MKGKGRVSVRIFLHCHVHTRISLRHTALQCDCIQFVGGPGDCPSRSIRCSVHFYLGPSQATFPSSEGEAGKADTEEGSQSVERQEWKHEWVPAASPDAREEGDVQVWLLKV